MKNTAGYHPGPVTPSTVDRASFKSSQDTLMMLSCKRVTCFHEMEDFKSKMNPSASRERDLKRPLGGQKASKENRFGINRKRERREK